MDLTALNHEDPILKVLGAAQERISKPKNWCQGSYGFNHSPHCAVGVILFMTTTDNAYLDCLDLLNTSAGQLGRYNGASDLNDSTDHPTVMAMFDRARALRMADMLEAAHAA